MKATFLLEAVLKNLILEDNLKICLLDNDLNLFTINFQLKLTIPINVRKQHFVLEYVENNLEDDLKNVWLEDKHNFVLSFKFSLTILSMLVSKIFLLKAIWILAQVGGCWEL